jgi:hypothetical protein
MIAVIAALLVLGGGAAAYFGVVVPNQPENKLKKAIQNLTEQEITTVRGSIDMVVPGASTNVAVNILHVDPQKQVALGDMVITVSGVKLPVEMRYVDNTAYVKLGDLSTLKSLAAGFGGPELAPVIDMVDKKVSEQWVEIDKTILNQATEGASQSAEQGSTCTADEIAIKLRAAVNEMLVLTTQDETKVYTITSTSTEQVEGESTTKMVLSIDEAKLADFGKKLNELPAVKDLEKCASSDVASEAEQTADTGKITTFNVWVGSDKQIKRVETAMEVTEANDGETVTTKLDMTMVKDAPTVEKPANAKPVMQLMGELQALFMQDPGSFDVLNGSLSL